MQPATNIDGQYFEKILTSLLDFLLLAGVGVEELQSQVEKHLSRAHNVRLGKAPTANKGGRYSSDTVSAAILHRWFRDPRLMDSRAQPKALRLYGAYPSIESLARAENTGGSAREIVKSIRSAGLVERAPGGRYKPKSRVATISTLHPMIVEHVAKSLTRYLRTIEQNTSAPKDKPRLIERFASIPDLSRKDLQAFREFAQTHGTVFLAGVDDWLESRRPRTRAASQGGGISAGIHVFAYVEDDAKRSSGAKKRRRLAKPA